MLTVEKSAVFDFALTGERKKKGKKKVTKDVYVRVERSREKL